MKLNITITSKPKSADSKPLLSRVKAGLKKVAASSPIQVSVTRVESEPEVPSDGSLPLKTAELLMD
jgi:hypothetical protein